MRLERYMLLSFPRLSWALFSMKALWVLLTAITRNTTGQAWKGFDNSKPTVRYIDIKRKPNDGYELDNQTERKAIDF